MSMQEEENQEKKEIQIIKGDGKDLDISPVYEHIQSDNPSYKNQKKDNIVIPNKSDDEE